jgi:hypothetical protein
MMQSPQRTVELIAQANYLEQYRLKIALKA